MTLSTLAIITVADFKSNFDRGFTYGTSFDTIRDKDIEQAINAGVPLFNAGLFDDLATQKIANLYLAAHLLVTNIKAAGGLSKKGRGIHSTGTFAISSKSAGPLSVGYAVPQEVVDNPALFQFTKTEYGQQYLQMLLPNLIGPMEIAGGRTQAL